MKDVQDDLGGVNEKEYSEKEKEEKDEIERRARELAIVNKNKKSIVYIKDLKLIFSIK